MYISKYILTVRCIELHTYQTSIRIAICKKFPYLLTDKMTETSWKFTDVEDDAIGSSNNTVRCPKHPFPTEIPPPPSLTKGKY